MGATKRARSPPIGGFRAA